MGSDSVGMTAAWYGALALGLTLVFVALWRSGFFGRLLAVIQEMLFNNWQLATLGAAALALSLASGYTTFDGLRNFTSAPLLSVLVAFGIQGVMLIVAWLIGETFATGMHHTLPRRVGYSRREALIGTSLGIVLIALVFYWTLSWSGAIGFTEGTAQHFRADWQRATDVSLYLLAGVVLLALVAFHARRGSAVLQPYVQSARLIARNAVLWVMLLAAMSASVFFSFDSHFNAIFPAEQRTRAAEIRTLNQVAGVVADTGERARKAQIAEAQRLFESDAWKAYDAELGKLALIARGAQAEIEAFLVGKMEERQRGIGAQQERIAGAERSRSALLRKRDELEAELQRLEPSIGALEAELAKAQAAYDETRQAIAAKQIDASAEEGGVEGTLKRGKGPVWRQRAAEIDKLQRKLAVADAPRLREAQRQRDAASARIVTLKRELATLAGEVAKYASAIQVAEHQVKTAQTLGDGTADGGGIDPPRALPALESARTAFRQHPGAERLADLQTRCGALASALAAAPATQAKVRGIDCDPRQAVEATARVFALNAGLLAFQAGCAGGSRLPQSASTDELLAFGRKCLQDSGLASKEAADLGARLQAIEMNRDDKAHRFVVTWNAILDGNRLAYLALALAIGIDGLVLVAGLFGAAAARSPLSDLPSPKARSAEQLEAIVRSALGEDRAKTADMVLAAMRPLGGDDHRCEVDLASSDAGQPERIRKVLVAGRSIGAVERADVATGAERYLVRPELIEFLSAIAGWGRGADSTLSSRTRRVPQKPSQTLPWHRSAAPTPPSEIEAVAVSPAAADPRSRVDSAELPVRSRLLLTDGRSGGRLSQDPDEDDLRGGFREALLAAVASEATTAAAELKRNAGAHANLRSILRRIEHEGRRALDRAAGALARECTDDEQARQLVDETRREITQVIPALMLQPELDLLDILLDVAAESDDDDLLQRLRTLRDDIERMDRADASAWRTIARRIRQLM